MKLTSILKKKPPLTPEERRAKYEHFPKGYLVLYAIAALSLIIYIVSRFSIGFSDFFNRYISSPLRIVFSFLTVWIPFSLTEMMLILMLPVLIVLTIYATKYRCDSWRAVGVFVAEVLAIAALILALFVLMFSTGYYGTTVDKKLGIEQADVNAQELYDTTLLVSDRMSELTDRIQYGEDGFSVMPYKIREMNNKLIDAYDVFCEDKDWMTNFYSCVKPVMLSELMSYTHVTGVYSYFTGEANINIAFPDYTIPYTAAHELAHQRGIAREDEANFVAYLVCLSSDDAYIRYSGYLSMYGYLLNALYSADKDLYKQALEATPDVVKKEIIAYNNFFSKYENSTASKVSGAFNDTYLKSQGTEGSVSYGMVVDLAVAYHKSENK